VISCEQLKDFCLDYLENELPTDECERFRRHLGQCPACVTFFETYRRTPELSREALAMEIPPEVKESIRSFLRTRTRDEG
jgi:anti-sigma factor RsiW